MKTELATDGPQMITDEQGAARDGVSRDRLNAITEKIIGRAFKIAGKLDSGFLEKCYENAMVYELRKAGLYVEQQAALSVSYKEIVFCEFVADLIVKREILIELKAIEQLAPTFSAQCINYLAATRLPICLLINFSGRVEVKRFAGPALRSVP